MPELGKVKFNPGPGDALLIVDVQNDFLPGGALGVPHGDEIIPVVNDYVERFESRGLTIVFSRDWHPVDHCSFTSQGGTWPPHCVQGSAGGEFAASIRIPESSMIISKATAVDEEAYSAFEGTGLAESLRADGVRRILILGLATDYCVLASVRDALAAGFDAVVQENGVRAVNIQPDDGHKALAAMKAEGAELLAA